MFIDYESRISIMENRLLTAQDQTLSAQQQVDRLQCELTNKEGAARINEEKILAMQGIITRTIRIKTNKNKAHYTILAINETRYKTYEYTNQYTFHISEYTIYTFQSVWNLPKTN